MKSVLFVGAGRRVEMIQKWQLMGWLVACYERTSDIPAFRVANICFGDGEKFSDTEYFEKDILSIQKEYGFDLIIPFMDEACVALARMKEKYPNLPILVSPLETCEACWDKLAFEYIFEDRYFYPKPFENYVLYDSEAPEFYWGENITKPRFGFGGKGDMSETVEQKFIDGTEYTVDCYFDKAGILLDFVPRIRLRTFDGEVISSVTVEPEIELSMIIASIITELKFIGPVNMQFIKGKDTGKFYLIEINPRFGGGYTLSMEAGLDIFGMLGNDYFKGDNTIDYFSWQRGLRVERALTDFYFIDKEHK